MFRIVACWLLGLLFVTLPALADAASPCRALYQKGRFAQAGACYLSQARRISTTKERARKGRAMRNAALCYAKAAKQRKHPAKKRFYWYERAARILHRYIKQGLAVNSYRLNSATRLRRKYLQSVRYGHLRILTEQRSARILLRGYRYRTKRLHKLARWLRPGWYRVKVTFPGPGKVVTRRVLVREGQRRRMVVILPPKAGVPPRRVLVRRVPPRPRAPVHNFDPDGDQPEPRARTRPRPRVALAPRRRAPALRPPPLRPRSRPKPRVRQPSVDELLRGFAPARRVASRPAPPPPTTKPPLHGGRIALLTIAGLGVVAAGIGAGLVVASNGSYDKAANVHAQLSEGGKVSGEAVSSDTQFIAEQVRNAQTFQTAGIVMISAGSGLAVIGLIWGLTLPARHKPARNAAPVGEWEVPE